MSATVWICLGEVDEWHPFCPFATASEERARGHEKWPGHWCIEDDNDLSRHGMWAESLRLEANGPDPSKCRLPSGAEPLTAEPSPNPNQRGPA